MGWARILCSRIIGAHLGLTSRDFGYLQNDRFIPIGAVPGGYVLSIAEDTARNIWIVNRQRGLIRLRDEAVEQIPGRRSGIQTTLWRRSRTPGKAASGLVSTKAGSRILWRPAQCRASAEDGLAPAKSWTFGSVRMAHSGLRRRAASAG